MTAQGVRRVRVHVPAHDGWPESVRGVGSIVSCPTCGEKCRGRSHAEARKALRMHRLDAHTEEREQCRPNAGGQIVHEFATTIDGRLCSCGAVVWKSLTDA